MTRTSSTTGLEHWCWFDDVVVRLLADGLAPTHQAELTAAIGNGPPGHPIAVAHLRHRDQRIELTVQTGTEHQWSRCAGVAAAAQTLAQVAGCSFFGGVVLTLGSAGVWLIGQDAPQVAKALRVDGWQLGAGGVVVTSAGHVAAGRVRLTDLALVRCDFRETLATAVAIEPAEAGEIRAWLRALAYEAPRDRINAAALAVRGFRLAWADVSAAAAMVATVAKATPTGTAPVPAAGDATETWLTMTDGALRLLSSNLDHEDRRLVDYVTGNFAAAAIGHECRQRPVFVSLARIDGEIELALSLSAQHLKRVVAPKVEPLLAHLDHALQQALLVLNPDRDIFLGSAAAAENGTVVWLSGPRQSGKSVLLLTLVAKQRLRFVADDFIVWDPASASVLPFPKPIRLRQSGEGMLEGVGWGLRVAASTSAPGVWLGNPWAENPVRPALTPGAVLVRCAWDRSLPEPFVVEPLDVLAELAARHTQRDREPDLAAIASRLHGISLRVRDHEAAAAYLAELARARSAHSLVPEGA